MTPDRKSGVIFIWGSGAGRCRRALRLSCRRDLVQSRGGTAPNRPQRARIGPGQRQGICDRFRAAPAGFIGETHESAAADAWAQPVGPEFSLQIDPAQKIRRHPDSQHPMAKGAAAQIVFCTHPEKARGGGQAGHLRSLRRKETQAKHVFAIGSQKSHLDTLKSPKNHGDGAMLRPVPPEAPGGWPEFPGAPSSQISPLHAIAGTARTRAHG